jgi:hypothetical protein
MRDALIFAITHPWVVGIFGAVMFVLGAIMS